MNLTHEYIHLKSDSNSKLNGYWTSDIGGVNEVTHIWEYGIWLIVLYFKKYMIMWKYLL